MADRTFIDKSYSLVKLERRIYCAVSVGAAGAVTLQKWNYPVFGMGTNKQTYTAAPTGTVTASTGNYPNRYQFGSEGVLSVTRTATGLWTVLMQDSYQRLVGLAGYISVAGGLSNIVSINENTTITNMNAAGGSVIGISLLSSTATAADPTSGHVVKLALTFADATEQ